MLKPVDGQFKEIAITAEEETSHSVTGRGELANVTLSVFGCSLDAASSFTTELSTGQILHKPSVRIKKSITLLQCEPEAPSSSSELTYSIHACQARYVRELNEKIERIKDDRLNSPRKEVAVLKIYASADPTIFSTLESIERTIQTREGGVVIHRISRLVSEKERVNKINMPFNPTQKDEIYSTLQSHHIATQMGSKSILYIRKEANSPRTLSTVRYSMLKNLAGDAIKIYRSLSKKGSLTHEVKTKERKKETITVSYNYNPIDIARFLIKKRQGHFSYSERVFLRELFKEIVRTPIKKVDETEKEAILAQMITPDASDVMAVVDATYDNSQVGINNRDIAFASSKTGALLIGDGVKQDSSEVVTHDHPFLSAMHAAMNAYILAFNFSQLFDPEEFGSLFESGFLRSWEVLSKECAQRIKKQSLGQEKPQLGLAIPFQIIDGQQHLYIYNESSITALIIMPKPGEILIDPDNFNSAIQTRFIQGGTDHKTTEMTGGGFGCTTTIKPIKGTIIPFPIGSAIFMYTDGFGEFVDQEGVTQTFLKMLYSTPTEINDAIIGKI
ncbi:MAG: hypothetical protein ACHQUC_04355, partial [Chlamydiales bacterium]